MGLMALLMLQMPFFGACEFIGNMDEEQEQHGGNETPGGNEGGEQGGNENGGEEQGGDETEQEAVFTVATYNLLKPSGRRDEMSLFSEKTKEVVLYSLSRAISRTGADLMAFNELDGNYISVGSCSLPKACSSLPWDWSIEWPNRVKDEDGKLEYSYANGFAWNPSLFELKESWYVWLSKTGSRWYTNPSNAYGNAGNPDRTCIMARFRHIASGKEFWFFVTHLPTPDQGGAANMAVLVNALAKEKTARKPSILCGDMNHAPGTGPYATLTSYWTDGNTSDRGTLSGSSKNYYYSVEEFTSEKHPERRIDHIMTRGAAATDYHTINEYYFYGGKYWCPSDHLPVVATITIK